MLAGTHTGRACRRHRPVGSDTLTPPRRQSNCPLQTHPRAHTTKPQIALRCSVVSRFDRLFIAWSSPPGSTRLTAVHPCPALLPSGHLGVSHQPTHTTIDIFVQPPHPLRQHRRTVHVPIRGVATPTYFTHPISHKHTHPSVRNQVCLIQCIARSRHSVPPETTRWWVCPIVAVGSHCFPPRPDPDRPSDCSRLPLPTVGSDAPTTEQYEC